MSCARIFVNELHSLEWLSILLARIAVGLLFFLSGRAKLFVRERREQMRQTLIEAHIPFPDFNALFVSIVEFVCGLLLVWGSDAAGVCAARLSDDCGDWDNSNSQYQNILASGVARGIFVSA